MGCYLPILLTSSSSKICINHWNSNYFFRHFALLNVPIYQYGGVAKAQCASAVGQISTHLAICCRTTHPIWKSRFHTCVYYFPNILNCLGTFQKWRRSHHTIGVRTRLGWVVTGLEILDSGQIVIFIIWVQK